MLPLVLAVLLFPGLILGDIQCASGDLSCPEGKTCCMVEGKQACCDDLEAQLPQRAETLFSNTSIVAQNGTWDNDYGCNFFNCKGTCCNSGYWGCCPIKMATCCPNNKCCDPLSTCCGGGCCAFMSNVCCGSWCCKSGSRCGRKYRECRGGATAMAPNTIIVSMVVLWLTIKMLPKM